MFKSPISHSKKLSNFSNESDIKLSDKIGSRRELRTSETSLNSDLTDGRSSDFFETIFFKMPIKDSSIPVFFQCY